MVLTAGEWTTFVTDIKAGRYEQDEAELTPPLQRRKPARKAPKVIPGQDALFTLDEVT
jgi:hypothetical protein